MFGRASSGAYGFASLVLLALLIGPAVRSSAQGLTVDTVGDALKIRAPGFSFLQGDPLVRLKDGQSVRVELAAMVLPAPGKSPATTTRRIFALSYDLWEERFAVTAVDARAQSASHLTLAAAEAWCVEQLEIRRTALGALGRDLPFWIRLEYRMLDGDSASDPSSAGYTLQALIDALSRRKKTESSPHALEAGPFRTPPRGSSFLPRGAGQDDAVLAKRSRHVFSRRFEAQLR